MIAQAGMNNDRLGNLIRGVATEMLEDQTGFWRFQIEDALVFVVTDESHNRMRIMTPVAELAQISEEECQVLLGANFDRALDARYCSNDGVVWSAFLHPLRELKDQQFLDALDQVVRLSKNFGTTYTSSDLIFCLLYTSPSPRDATLSRMPSSA